MRIIALSAVLVLAACSQKQSKRDAIPDLLAADAQIVVRLASIERIDSILDLAGAPGMTPSLRMVVGSLPGAEADSFPADAPLGFAVALPRDGGDPVFTFALRARDAEGLAAKFTDGSARALDNHLGVSSLPEYPTGGCRLWSDMPEGAMSARIDLGGLGGTANPMVAMVVGQASDGARFLLGILGAAAPGLDAARLADGFEAWLGEVVDSGERLDCVMDLDDAMLRVDVAYTAKAGTRLADGAAAKSGLTALAAHAPDGWPYVLLFSLDRSWIGRLAGAPEADGVLSHLGDEWLLAGSFDGSRPRFVIAARAQDGPAAGAALATLLASAPLAEMGLVCTEEELDAKGAFGRRLRLSPDPAATGERAERVAKFVGPEGIAVEVLARKDLLLVTAGEQDLAPRLLAASKPPAGLTKKLPTGDRNIHFLAVTDMGRFVAGMQGLMEPEEAARFADIVGAVELHGTSSDRTWTWGIRADRRYIESIRQFAGLPGGPPRPPR